MKTFVTGSTGLLGGHIVRTLLEGGHEVSALVRSREAGRAALGEGVRLVVGDQRRVEAFEDELRGVEALIHAGACHGEFYRPGGREDVLWETNVTGTLRLLEAAVQQGVRHVVYVSSAAVLGGKPGLPIDETFPYVQALEDPYMHSKLEAERRVLDFAHTHPAVHVVLILPSMLAGPGDRGPTPFGAFLLSVLRGDLKAIPPGAVPVTDARDVAQTAVAALSLGRGGERYLVSAPRVELAALVRTIGEASGRPVPSRQPPPALINTVARVMGWVSMVTGKPAPLKLAHLKRLQARIQYDSGKSRRELQAQYRPLSETVRDTVAWFQSHGYAAGNEQPRKLAA